MDPAALRALVHHGPRRFYPLSALGAADTFLRRVEVETVTGERMLLTFRLTREDSLRAAYKGIHMSKRYVARLSPQRPLAAMCSRLLPLLLLFLGRCSQPPGCTHTELILLIANCLATGGSFGV